MEETPSGIGKGIWVGLAVVGLLIAIPAGCVLSVTVPRSLADAHIEPKCNSECGIRVLEKVLVESDEARTIGKASWAAGRMERPIGADYVLKQSYVFMQPFGASVYKYTSWVERRTDGKKLGEVTWYFRQGDEVFHGKHFPQPRPTEEQLVLQTLLVAPPNNSLQSGPAQAPAAEVKR